MKKRILALLLSIVLLIPLVCVQTSAAETFVVIEWNEPAIPADAGETIDLASYKVRFGEKDAEAVPEWSYEGKKITSFKADAAGVYTLQAECGGKTKDIYVVAKEKDEKEYVLYFNDFLTEDSINDFTKQTSYNSRYSVSDSNLVIDATGQDMVRINLPLWLSAFGNYQITASVRSTDERDTARWNSICYRSKDLSYPFYHMCVRKNSSASNGVEYAIRTPSNAWSVITTAGTKANQSGTNYYKYNIQVKDNTIKYSIDDVDLILNEDKKDYKSGSVGFIANYSKMHIDWVKVTLQLSTPDITVPPTLIVPTETVENISNAFVNVADIVSSDGFTHLDNAATAIIHVSGDDIVDANGKKIGDTSKAYELIGDDVIPLFYCNSKEDIDKVTRVIAVNDSAYYDAGIVSGDAEVIAYSRKKQNKVRCIIDLRGKFDHILTAEDILAVRELINSNNCKVGILDSSCLDQAAVSELRSHLVTIWVYDDCATRADAIEAIIKGGHGVVSPSPDTVKEAYSFFEEQTLTRTPIIIGHRGNPTQAPENSLSSYRIAYENGADVIETDVYLSTDGRIVVMHDGDISRTTTGTGNIETMSLEKIKSFSLWGENDAYKNKFPDEKIPTLDEIFEFIKGKDLKLFIEIKTSKAIAAKINALAEEYGVLDQISIIAFSIDQCANMEKASPAVSAGWLTSGIASSTNYNMACSALSTVLKNVVPKNTTINPAYTGLTDKFVEAANDRGLTVWPWTYSASLGDRFCYAFMSGFGGLTTNDAQYTKATVKSISVDKTEFSLKSGEAAAFTVNKHTYGRNDIDISDKVDYSVISGDGVVEIKDGKIVALKPGIAKIAFRQTFTLPQSSNSYKYTLYTDVVTINVASGEPLDKVTLFDDSPLTIANGMLTNVKANTNSKTLLANLMNPDLRITKGDSVLSEKEIVGTGCIVEAYDGDKVIDKVTVIVKGDLDGDGKRTDTDVAAIREVLLGGNDNDVMNIASDIDSDGNVTVTDYIMSRLNQSGKYTID